MSADELTSKRLSLDKINNCNGREKQIEVKHEGLQVVNGQTKIGRTASETAVIKVLRLEERTNIRQTSHHYRNEHLACIVVDKYNAQIKQTHVHAQTNKR